MLSCSRMTFLFRLLTSVLALKQSSARLLQASSSSSSGSSSTSSSSTSSSSTSSSSTSSIPSQWITGIATNYGGPSEGKDPNNPSFGTSDGSCGYGDLQKEAYPFWSVAALSTSNRFYKAGPGNGCGECFEIQCQNSGGQFPGRCNSDPSQQSVTVLISDSCPECEADHIDMQALTFNKVAPMLNGRIDIKYRRVECTPPVPVKVQIDGNSGPGGWLRLAVTTNGGSGGVKSVQVKGPNSGWTGLNNLFGAEWETGHQPELPNLHVTADNGQEITAFGVITKSGQTGIVSTGQHFNFNGPPSYNEASSAGGSSSSSSSSSSGSSSASSSGSSSSSSPASSASSPSSSDASNIQSSIAKGGSSTPSTSSGGSSLVSAYDGPPSSSTSSSSQKSPSNTCNDVSPDEHGCAQQKKWGKCSKSWLQIPGANLPYGYCANTCGRC